MLREVLTCSGHILQDFSHTQELYQNFECLLQEVMEAECQAGVFISNTHDKN